MLLVPIIAGFIILLSLFDVLTPNAVTATSHQATAGARVGLHAVAVITVFTLIQPAVPAHLPAALVIASIAQVLVAVVAGLISLGILIEIIACNPIATARNETIVRATILVELVSVVARLLSLKALTVTATSEHAITQTRIRIELITIIAGFALVSSTVTTGFNLASEVAPIARLTVPIIARFARI